MELEYLPPGGLIYRALFPHQNMVSPICICWISPSTICAKQRFSIILLRKTETTYEPVSSGLCSSCEPGHQAYGPSSGSKPKKNQFMPHKMISAEYSLDIMMAKLVKTMRNYSELAQSAVVWFQSVSYSPLRSVLTPPNNLSVKLFIE